MGTADEQPDAFKVIETDNMTGWDRYLDNMGTAPWSGTFTREQAEADVEWRKANITGRYSYAIVPVEPWMTDNGEARKWHDDRHGSHRMEDCGHVACREATTRLLHEELNRQFAEQDAARSAAEASNG
jgi:hypothetical protein